MWQIVHVLHEFREDKVPRRVIQWTLKKKELTNILVKAMSLYEGLKTKVKVESKFSEEFYVSVGVHQRSVLSPLLFALWWML